MDATIKPTTMRDRTSMVGRSSEGRSPEGRWEYRFYVAFFFALFLPVITASRLLPRSWRPFKSAEATSVIGEARAAAYSVVPFIFMV